MTDRNADMLPTDREPRGKFEQWTKVNISGVSSSRLMPRWFLVALGAALALPLTAAVFLKSGSLGAAMFGVGAILLVVLFLRQWFVMTAKGHRYLVSRSDLGDEVRLAALAGLFLVIPTIGLLLGALGLIGLMAVRGY